MPTKTRARSSILAAVHETASDLHRLGFIDKRKMDRFDALCLQACRWRESKTRLKWLFSNASHNLPAKAYSQSYSLARDTGACVPHF
jgi:hypothetical protein